MICLFIIYLFYDIFTFIFMMSCKILSKNFAYIIIKSSYKNNVLYTVSIWNSGTNFSSQNMSCIHGRYFHFRAVCLFSEPKFMDKRLHMSEANKCTYPHCLLGIMFACNVLIETLFAFLWANKSLHDKQC